MSKAHNIARTEQSSNRASVHDNLRYQAVVIHGPGHASLDVVPGASPGPRDILIRVAYVGVCATDLEIFRGELGYYKSGLAKYPIIPGHEFSGTVAAVGSTTGDFSVGDAVVVECIQGCGECTACARNNPIGCTHRREVGVIGRDGGYAEFVVAAVQFVHRVPNEVGLRRAALAEPMAVVIKGIGRLEHAWGPEAGPRRCAVVGGGPIGNLAAQALTHRRHQVTVFDRSPERLAYLEGTNIATAQDLSRLDEFDAIVEATGDPDALHEILHNSAAGTTLLLLGLPYAHRDFSFEAIVGYDKTIVGSVGSNGDHFAAALDMLRFIDADAFLDKHVPLSEYLIAWELQRARRHLKVMLKVDPLADN